MVRRLTTVSAFAALALLLSASGVHAQKPAAKKYPFANPPLDIHDQFAKAELCPVTPIVPADRKILAEFWAARSANPAKVVPEADDAAVAIHLLAAGVDDAEKRAEYLTKFNELVASARTATAGAKTDRERADRLLRHLHKTAMAKGYEAKTTTLPDIFDSGKYNCVSSSALYYLVGTRLGLKLQPVLISGSGFIDGHAAVDLLDHGTRIEIETTNADGYDWPTKLKKPGVIAIGSQPDRKKARDSDGFGLAASTASNVALGASKAEPPRHGDAVRLMVIALALGPTDPSLEQNTVAELSNWGLQLFRAKKFEDALKVYAFARAALGPTEAERNHKSVWEEYLDETFESRRVPDGVKLLARAAAAFPNESDFTRPGKWVIREADRIEDRGKEGWPGALAFADAAIKHLADKDAKEVRAWKDESRRLWSQGLLRKGDIAGSLKVITDGFAEAPGSRELENGLLHHAAEAIEYLDAKKSTTEAVAHFKELCETFPKNKELREVAAAHVRRVVNKLADDKKFGEALKLADTYPALAGEKLAGIKADVYGDWARALSAEKKWAEGWGKHTEGLAALSKCDRLGELAVNYLDRWADTAIKNKDWDEAVRIYDIGMKQFPDNSHLKYNREYCVKQKK